MSREIAPDLLERLRARFANHPLHRFLGVRFVDLQPDLCTVEADLHPPTDNGSGTIHGGVVAILADLAIAGALSTNFDGKMGFATSNLNLHFLRRAKDRAIATARIVKKGSTICVARVDVVDGNGDLAAIATSDFVLTTSKLPDREP
ncbi:MAG TPA: PaaI family thioesterase [Thermoanaerobaculia bacterium]|nr:PaaI family thioesterase [Thermoanaerobaculia bacterium]